MKRYCLAIDLKDDPLLIAEYKIHHKKVWPEIIQSLKDAGIYSMEIYCTGNRLFMVMETEDLFDFDKKAIADASNPIVQEWEKLMWNYQKALPPAQPNEKWVLMDLIFNWKV